MKLKAALKSEQNLKCAICKDNDDGLMLCAKCNTVQHASCMIEFKGCSGCGNSDPHAEKPAKKKTETKTSSAHTLSRQDSGVLCDPSFGYCHYPMGTQHFCPYHRITTTDDYQVPKRNDGPHGSHRPCRSCGPHTYSPGDMQSKRTHGCCCCSCWRYRSSEERDRVMPEMEISGMFVNAAKLFVFSLIVFSLADLLVALSI